MTMTLTDATDALKRTFQDGRPIDETFTQFPLLASISKDESFRGTEKQVSVLTEHPQGVSADFATALGSLAPSTYKKFLLTRTQYYGIARITGPARAAAQDEGTTVDLWKNEVSGVMLTVQQDLEVFITGNGTGVIGTLDGSHAVAATTVYLSDPTDVIKFAIGMRVGLVSSATSLSPTLRSGWATVSGVDRTNGTITFASNLSTLITGALNTDSFVRAGNQASAGTAAVPIGSQLWIDGTGATLFSLTRSTDPVRLAGQTLSCAGVSYEDAVINLEYLLVQQGQRAGGDYRLMIHPKNMREWKKQMAGRAFYPRVGISGRDANNEAVTGFSAIEFEGDMGKIPIMVSPFVPYQSAHLYDMERVSLDSAGPSVGLLDYNSPENVLVTPNADAYDVRVGGYLQINMGSAPVRHVRGTSFGA